MFSECRLHNLEDYDEYISSIAHFSTLFLNIEKKNAKKEVFILLNPELLCFFVKPQVEGLAGCDEAVGLYVRRDEHVLLTDISGEVREFGGIVNAVGR